VVPWNIGIPSCLLGAKKKIFKTNEIFTIGALKKKFVLLLCLCVCVCFFSLFFLVLLMHVFIIREETDSREKVVDISEFVYEWVVVLQVVVLQVG
jgi:hypothetical protein